MRKYLFLFYVIIFQITCFANEDMVSNLKKNHPKGSSTSSRIYLNVNDIHLDEGAIFVCLNSEWTQVNALHSDDKGMYIDNLWPFLSFYCENCSTWNESWRINCKNCGLRRPD